MDTIILDWDKLAEKTGAEDMDIRACGGLLESLGFDLDNVNITAYQEDIEGNPWKLAIKSI